MPFSSAGSLFPVAKAQLSAAAVTKYRELVRKFNATQHTAAVDQGSAAFRQARKRALIRLRHRKMQVASRLNPVRALSNFFHSKRGGEESSNSECGIAVGEDRESTTHMLGEVGHDDMQRLTSSNPLLRVRYFVLFCLLLLMDACLCLGLYLYFLLSEP